MRRMANEVVGTGVQNGRILLYPAKLPFTFSQKPFRRPGPRNPSRSFFRPMGRMVRVSCYNILPDCWVQKLPFNMPRSICMSDGYLVGKNTYRILLYFWLFSLPFFAALFLSFTMLLQIVRFDEARNWCKGGRLLRSSLRSGAIYIFVHVVVL